MHLTSSCPSIFKFSKTCAPITTILVFGLIMAVANVCQAHFLWVGWQKTDGQETAALFFGESSTARDYHLPESVAKNAQLSAYSGKVMTKLETAQHESDDFVGMVSTTSPDSDAVIVGHCTYGLYHGMLLKYLAKHYSATALNQENAGMTVTGIPIDATATRVDDNSLKITATWEGKPAAGLQVSWMTSGGRDVEKETVEDGTATFDDLTPGTHSFLLNRSDKEATGEYEGTKYHSEAYYVTLVVDFDAPVEQTHQTSYEPKKVILASSDAADNAPEETPEVVDHDSSAIPPLPEGVASFGGTIHGGHLYVYSGHIGRAHAHSHDNLSPSFRRVALSGGQWEDLPMQTRLQGLPLVAHGHYVYRVGGLSAKNRAGEEDDLHSVDEFARFCPTNKRWTSLSPLPEPRSSHDAVVIRDHLYVVGGWQLSGDSDGTWHPTAWRADLTEEPVTWTAIADPPFQKRALAIGHWNGKLVAIGGMDEFQEISNECHCYSPEDDSWTSIATFPGKNEDTFGLSAWHHDGNLYACGLQGVLYRLSEDAQSWRNAGSLPSARFFHRLLSGNGRKLLIVAGASFTEGHLAHTDVYTLKD